MQVDRSLHQNVSPHAQRKTPKMRDDSAESRRIQPHPVWDVLMAAVSAAADIVDVLHEGLHVLHGDRVARSGNAYLCCLMYRAICSDRQTDSYFGTGTGTGTGTQKGSGRLPTVVGFRCLCW